MRCWLSRWICPPYIHFQESPLHLDENEQSWMVLQHLQKFKSYKKLSPVLTAPPLLWPSALLCQHPCLEGLSHHHKGYYCVLHRRTTHISATLVPPYHGVKNFLGVTWRLSGKASSIKNEFCSASGGIAGTPVFWGNAPQDLPLWGIFRAWNFISVFYV